jgi:uncharacterized membrane protein
MAIILAVCAGLAEARMYQWSNAATGSIQLSGSPPAWYRSPSPGPRILVFDNGQLIDDTAVPVSEEQRRELRAEALGGRQESEFAEISAADESALHDALENAAQDGVDVSAVTEAFNAEQARVAEADEGAVEQTVAELKALLDAWDGRRLNEAKALLRDTIGGVE